jgi:class 3 adenylate cyclase
MTNLSDQSSGALTFLFTEIEGSTKRWETDEAGKFFQHTGGEQ